MEDLRRSIAAVRPVADRLTQEERLWLATEASEIGWWEVLHGTGEMTWCPRVKAMFGVSAGAAVTLEDFYRGLHPDDHDRVVAAYAAATDPEQRRFYNVEYRTIGKEDGVIRWVAAKGRGVIDAAGRCQRTIGTAVDITSRMQLQEEKLARDQEAAELRDQFIAVLGHDLKNPLAAIASATRILQRHPDRAVEMAGHIDQSVFRMTELIDNILDFARGRLGDGIVATRDATEPLEPVLIQVIDELKVVHPEQQVVVDIDLREPVACDRPRIAQLLSNLLGNAFTYATSETPIQVRARSKGGTFELSVCNSGPPIDRQDLDMLFEPFFRGKVRGSREGLGLGLYICSEIAKAHGGTISVSLESGITCFALRMASTV